MSKIRVGISSGLLVRPRLYWVLFLSLLVVIGCSDTPVSNQSITSRVIDAQPEIRLSTSASVLIIESIDQETTPIGRVQISPDPIVLDPGESVDLSAVALSTQGTHLPDVEFSWHTVDPMVGTVTRNGRLQAGTRPGAYSHSVAVTAIQNTSDGIDYMSKSVTITVVGDVELPKLVGVEIIPGNLTLFQRQIYRLRAIGFDEDGTLIPAVNFVWKLNHDALGSLNDLGYLTVEGDEGTYHDAVSVSGIWEGVAVSAVSDIRVTNAPQADDVFIVHALPQRFYLDPGDRLKLQAVALNGLGEVVAGSQLRWSMEDDGAGTIDGDGNFIAGNDSGVYTQAVKVEALVPGERGFARAADLASVVIRERESFTRMHTLFAQPNLITVSPGGRMAPLARAVGDTGNPAGDVTFSWEVLIDGSVEINDLGILRAGDVPGIYPKALQVTAEQTLEGETVTKTSTIDVVITGNLSRSEVHPTLASIITGKTVHFSLDGWDENEVLLPGLIVLWSLLDESVGTIDAFGNFTAGDVPGLYQDAIRAEVIQQLSQ